MKLVSKNVSYRATGLQELHIHVEHSSNVVSIGRRLKWHRRFMTNGLSAFRGSQRTWGLQLRPTSSGMRDVLNDRELGERDDDMQEKEEGVYLL
jgi:hypothetical protein